MNEKKRRSVLLTISMLVTVFLGLFLAIAILMYEIPKIYVYYNTDKLIPDTLYDYQFGSDRRNNSYYLDGTLQNLNQEVRMRCNEVFFDSIIAEKNSGKAEKLAVWYFFWPRKVYYRNSKVFDRAVIGRTIFKGVHIILIPIFISGSAWVILARRERKYKEYLKQQKLQRRKEKKK